jgi:hypothetical protein
MYDVGDGKPPHPQSTKGGSFVNRAHSRFVKGRTAYAFVVRGVRTGDNAERSGWEAPILGALVERKVKLLVGQL